MALGAGEAVLFGIAARHFAVNIAQRRPWCKQRLGLWLLFRVGPGERRQRQTQAHGGVAWHQEQVIAFERPTAAFPAMRLGNRVTQRERIAHDGAQVLLQQTCQTAAFGIVFQVGITRVDADRQGLLLPKVVVGIFVGGNPVALRHAQTLAQRMDEALYHGVVDLGVGRAFGAGQPLGVAPQGRAILAPVTGQRPARQRFARVPLALLLLNDATGRVGFLQSGQQRLGALTLVLAQRFGVPLGALHVVDGNEGRLAPHGQANILLLEGLIHLVAQRQNGLPLLIVVGAGDARVFVDALHAHLDIEFHFALVGETGNGRGAASGGGGGQRNMPFTSEQAGGGVQAHPACARQEDFGPGMQVGKVHLGTAGAIQRFDVRGQLNQIAGYKASRQPQMAQDLYQ